MSEHGDGMKPENARAVMWEPPDPSRLRTRDGTEVEHPILSGRWHPVHYVHKRRRHGLLRAFDRC